MHFELQFKATLQPDDYRFIVANHNGTEIAQTTYFEITEPSAIQGMACLLYTSSFSAIRVISPSNM